MDKENKKMIALGKGTRGGDAVWGSITGDLANQTDLQNALDAKADSSSVPTKTSDLTNDSGFRTVVDINDMTQAELLDFYTNYATRMTENTYVVGGYTFSTLTVTDPQVGTVLVLEYNPQFKDQAVGATAGTIDVTVGVVYILANGTKTSTTMTYNVPRTSSLATVATSGDYTDLTNKPTIPAAQIQSDWNQSDNTQVDFILNKPTLGTMASESTSDYTPTSGLATVATSGSYSDLTNKPTIPTVNDSTITIQKNGTTVDTFTTNESTNKTINITGVQNEITSSNKLSADLVSDGTDNKVFTVTEKTKLSGMKPVVEVTSMTQAELIDFYTNYATLMGQNTYVVNGYDVVAITVTDQQAGTVLVLEYNVRYKDSSAGAASGTIDVVSDVLYILANGTNVTNTLTYNVPKTSSLATVATSGSYSDLTNKPTIPAAQIQSDWDQTTTTSLDYIKNKPTIPDAVSGINDGTNWTSITIGSTTKAIPSGGGGVAQVQSDWTQTDNTQVDYIKNKPTIPDTVSGVNDNTYWTSLTIGSTTKAIPAAQVQANWNESDTNSSAYIQNKPTIPTVDVTAAGNNTFSGVNSFTTTTHMRNIELELTNTGDTRTYTTNVYPNYVGVHYGGDSNLTEYTSNISPQSISVYDDDGNSTEIYNNYITVSNSGGSSITVSPSTFGTETLTFIDSNNISTTVVVWTQPQI